MEVTVPAVTTLSRVARGTSFALPFYSPPRCVFRPCLSPPARPSAPRNQPVPTFLSPQLIVHCANDMDTCRAVARTMKWCMEDVAPRALQALARGRGPPRRVRSALDGGPWEPFLNGASRAIIVCHALLLRVCPDCHARPGSRAVIGLDFVPALVCCCALLCAMCVHVCELCQGPESLGARFEDPLLSGPLEWEAAPPLQVPVTVSLAVGADWGSLMDFPVDT
jgi:hypothetical protein